MDEAHWTDRLPDLLDRTLSESRPNNRLVIVSTRATNLDDTDRFQQVWDDLNKRGVLSRITCLDVSNDAFGKYFQLQ